MTDTLTTVWKLLQQQQRYEDPCTPCPVHCTLVLCHCHRLVTAGMDWWQQAQCLHKIISSLTNQHLYRQHLCHLYHHHHHHYFACLVCFLCFLLCVMQAFPAFPVTLSLSDIARLDDSADAKKVLTALLPEDLKRPPGCLRIAYMTTVLNDLESHNLTAVSAAQNHPFWRFLIASGTMHS